MKLREADNLINKINVWERLITPKCPEQPLIRLIENKDIGCYEATFGVKLIGVSYTGKRDEKPDNRAYEMKVAKNCLIDGLSNDQRIDFIYSGGRKRQGDLHFDWKIMGSSKGETPEDATRRANNFWQNLNVMLGTLKNDYCFAPLQRAEVLSDNKTEERWAGEIKPEGITVRAGESIGFLKQEEKSDKKGGIIITPFNEDKEQKFFRSVTAGAVGCPTKVKLVLSMSPLTLQKEELQRIAAALKWLRNGHANAISYHNWLKERAEDVTIGKLLNILELWLRNPSGYRVTCTAFSSKPVPESYLSMVGRELFSCPISVTTKSVGSEVADSSEEKETRQGNDFFDLGDCINSELTGFPLFPEVSSLIDCGVKKVYRQSNVKLSQDGIILGHSDIDTPAREVHFAKSDRSRHCYIIGSTGTGKSTLLYNMIRQDIENGEGVTLIDPHGDLYQKVLRSIPEHRIDDVVLVDPCDFEYSAGINFLECEGQYKHIQMNYVVNEMIKIFDRLYDLRQTGGPIFEQYMRNAMLLVMDNDFHIATLMDIPMVFEDEEYRNFLISKCKNPFVESFWIKQAKKADGEASLRNMAPYITSKLNQFTANALLRPIIGQSRSTINFRKVMDEGKILLVNLSKGLLGEMDTQLLGMLVIGKIFSAAMSRVSIPAEQRRSMFLYVDEFQNFTTDTVAHLLSESRKFGISLILANQNLSQLLNSRGSYSVIDAVLGNVGTMLIFRLGAVDAERMQIYTKPELEAQDLQNLPDFHVAARLLNNNTPTRPFVFKTVQAPNISRDIDINRIVNAARKEYMRSTIEVEDEIIKRRTSYNVLKEIESDIVEELSEKI